MKQWPPPKGFLVLMALLMLVVYVIPTGWAIYKVAIGQWSYHPASWVLFVIGGGAFCHMIWSLVLLRRHYWKGE